MSVVAHATRTGDWWAVEVPAIPGLFTQAKRLDQIPALIEDAAGMLGVDVAAADVRVEAMLSAEDRALVELAHATRSAARNAEAEASAASRAVVARLRGEGLTVRDVATVIGVSPQRVSALTS